MGKFERLLPRDSEIQTVAQVAPATNWPTEREIMPRRRKTAAMDSKAEEIGDFDENLPAIIQKSIGNVEEVTVGILAEAGIEILKVAVVTEVDGGTRMEKIREEQIGVEVFGRLERSQILVGKDCRILTNEAKREFASELVVPFRANDVIVENVGAGREIAETREEVSVIDSELTSGADGKKDLRVARLSKDRRAGDRRAKRRGDRRSIKVGVGAPANLAVHRDLLEEGRMEEETRMMVSIVAITRKSAEVDWAKALVTQIAEEAEKYLALKLKTVIGVGKPFKTRALVVPVVDGKKPWPMPDEMLAFRTKSVEGELAEAADVGAAKETGLGLESL